MRVSSIQVRALCEAMETRGVSLELIVNHGLSCEPSGYGWLDLDELDRLITCAVELTRDPAFGLYWGAQSPMLQLDLITPLAAHSPSLRACLEALMRVQTMLCDEPEMELVESSQRALLRLRALPTSPLVTRVRSEWIVVGLFRLFRHFGVPGDAIRRVSLSYPAPAYAEEYARILGVPVTFEQSYTAIEFDRQQLERTRPLHNSELFTSLTQQAERVIARSRSGLTFSERVKSELRRSRVQMQPLGVVARSLGMSERSLRRHLAHEGSSFSSLIQENQSELACTLLSQPGRSIKEVAHELQFSHVSAFNRAFKRWTGRSPSEYRRTPSALN